eukprot:Clim_evm4s168 gene=Clim_evmTU4s168
MPGETATAGGVQTPTSLRSKTPVASTGSKDPMVSRLMDLLSQATTTQQTHGMSAYIDLLNTTGPGGSVTGSAVKSTPAGTNMSATAARRRIAERSGNGEEFLRRHEQISKRVQTTEQQAALEGLTIVLSRCLESAPVVKMLARTVDQAGPQGLAASQYYESLRGRIDLRSPQRKAGAPPGPTVKGHQDSFTHEGVQKAAERNRSAAYSLRNSVELSERFGGPSIFKLVHQKGGSQSKENGNVQDGTPEMPKWYIEKSAIHVPDPSMYKPTGTSAAAERQLAISRNVKELSYAAQEAILMSDLLYALTGVSGRWITLSVDRSVKNRELVENYGMTFSIREPFDGALLRMAEMVLPLCANFCHVHAFMRQRMRFQDGRTLHALCNALRDIEREYLLLIAQLDSRFRSKVGLTLHHLWTEIQPSAETYATLTRLLHDVAVENLHGGKVISMVHRHVLRSPQGSKNRALMEFLFERTAAPFMETLQTWLALGRVADGSGDFMIAEDQSMTMSDFGGNFNSDYWERHFTVRHEMVPSFLQPYAEKILCTGKYIDVIQHCAARQQSSSRKVTSRDSMTHEAVAALLREGVELKLSIEEADYYRTVDHAYTRASRTLLMLLMGPQRLPDVFHSLKAYFLFSQGDVIGHFLDMADEELSKPVHDIVPNRLQSLLELALRTGSAPLPYYENVESGLVLNTLVQELSSILNVLHASHEADGEKGTGDGDELTLNDLTDTQHEEPRVSPYSLTGHEAFTLHMNVSWPKSLVVHQRALTKYKLLFRQLFHCKHVERQLCQIWLGKKAVKMLPASRTGAIGQASRMWQRMINFIKSLTHYMAYEVIDPAFHAFQQQLPQLQTVDELITAHNDFLDTCIKQCMLSNQKLMKIISKLTGICIIYCNYLKRFLSGVGVMGGPDGDFTLTQRAEIMESLQTLANDETFMRTMRRFDDNFTSQMHSLLDTLLQSSDAEADANMAALVSRLDYNNYYTATSASQRATRVASAASTSLFAAASAAAMANAADHQHNVTPTKSVAQPSEFHKDSHWLEDNGPETGMSMGNVYPEHFEYDNDEGEDDVTGPKEF